MLDARQCPDCESRMQPLRAGAVEVYRCFFCGGTWFDRDQLAQATGRPIALEPLAGHTDRRCAHCRISLTTTLLRSVPVETCGSCGGIYLDDGELAEVAGRPVPLQERGPAPAGSKAGHGLTFRCSGCGDTFPVLDGVTTAQGLTCSRCSVGHEIGPANLSSDGDVESWSSWTVLGAALDFVLSVFLDDYDD